MKRNEYDGVLEPWQTKLITNMAGQAGFRRQDLQDAQQFVALKLLTCRFDFTQLENATEATAFRTIVDHLLTMLRRTEARRRKRFDRYAEKHGVREVELPRFDQLDLSKDVQTAIATLTPFDQSICQRLADGESLSEVARNLGTSRQTVREHMSRIGEHLERLGLGLHATLPATKEANVA